MADEIALYAQKHGYYYGLHAWDSGYKSWCKEYNGGKDIPDDVITELKGLHLIFCDYFKS